MRWIKASERLPNKNGYYHCLIKYFHTPETELTKVVVEFKCPFWTLYEENYVVEWLDESTPEGVTADLLEKLKDDTHDAIWDSIYAEGGEVGGGNKAVEKCVEIAIEYASLVSSSDKKEIARLKEDVKELVEGLDSYPGFGSFSYNPAEAVAWVQKIDTLIQKHKQ